MRVLAVDPGRGKCGIAVVDETAGVLERKVVDRTEFGSEVAALKLNHSPDVVVVGDRTGARPLLDELETLFPGEPVETVDEHGSSLEGRRRYFREHPPRGLWRLVPLSLRYPPAPFDDLVAVILAERFLAGREAGREPPPG